MPHPHQRQHQHHVAYIAGGRMPPGYDWIYLRDPGVGRPNLLLRAGTDERRAFLEVVEMLADEADADRAAAGQQRVA